MKTPIPSGFTALKKKTPAGAGVYQAKDMKIFLWTERLKLFIGLE